MAKGGKREGAGRKPGVPNKRTVAQAEAIQSSGLTPLDYMMSLLRDEANAPEIRFEAAKAAAPYVHAKLANVELNASVAFSHEDALDQLDDERPGEADSEASED